MLDLADQEIADAYEQHAPEMLMTWCFRLKKERDRYREIANRAKDIDGEMEALCLKCLNAQPKYGMSEGVCVDCQMHDAEVEKLKRIVKELVTAMEQYEMDVDESPPYKHRELMRRAREVLE